MWSAADRAAVSYELLKRNHANNPQVLRELYELVGDKESVALLDRNIMGQGAQVEVTDMGPRHG